MKCERFGSSVVGLLDLPVCPSSGRCEFDHCDNSQDTRPITGLSEGQCKKVLYLAATAIASGLLATGAVVTQLATRQYYA